LYPLVPLYVVYFLIDNTFNTLRLGLAIGFVLLAFGLWHRSRSFLALISAVIGVSIQFTSVVIPALFLLHRLRVRRWLFVPLIVAFVLFLGFYSARIEGKVALYSAGQEQKGWSGLSLAVIALALLIISSRALGISLYEALVTLAIVSCAVPNQYGFLTIRIAQLLLILLAIEVGQRVVENEAEEVDFQNGAHARTRVPKLFRSQSNEGAIGFDALRSILFVCVLCAAAYLRFRNIISPMPDEFSPYVPFYLR